MLYDGTPIPSMLPLQMGSVLAARYQIVVMCMIFASAGISTAIFLALMRRWVTLDRD